MKSDSYKILVVDDEDSIRELLSKVLSSKGYKCDTAADGVEALEKFNAATFDAVIADIAMPRMDGLQLTRELTGMDTDLPVMLMTGFVNEYDYDDAVKAGASDFIKKPLGIEELMARFDRMMHNCETICKIKIFQKDLEEVSRQMINGIENDAMKKIEDLNRQLSELKDRIRKS
ncbi:MAG: response regulator [Nitrospirae bacterium]|nr:response regulator [Nitrospirota bacterium]